MLNRRKENQIVMNSENLLYTTRTAIRHVTKRKKL